MSDLRRWQDAVRRICLSSELDPTDVRDAGGYDARWTLYRTMVRARFRRVIREGAPRTTRALGADAMDALVDAFVAAHPPQSRYLRTLVAEFATWASSTDLPAAARDAMDYDVAVIHARDARELDDVDVEAFAFERRPVVSATVRVLQLGHAVHRDGASVDPPADLLVYRHGETLAPRWLELTPIEAAVVRAWASTEASAADAAIAAAQATGTAVDEAFAEVLGDLVARLLERGALRGSAAS